MTSEAERMMHLFEGFAGAHGTHGGMESNASKGGKMEIKKSAMTLREPVTVALWQQHLDGKRPLGVIPIREDGTCYWGCVDVDRYDINLSDVVAEVEKRSLPLVVCRTKSGGAHVFLFLREPAPAADMRAMLQQLAAGMGWGGSEIFPKQSQILSDRGDLGNWLNMPYLDAANTKRYGIKPTGTGMTLSEFLKFAESRRVLMSEVEEPTVVPDETLDDGPPCLQHLSSVGFPEGTRNNGLFGLGVFCKKKYGDRWKSMLEEYNRRYMDPPLAADEVQRVIQSLEKKDYQYKCKDAPCVSYCNVSLCKTRKFGVGASGMYPTVSGMAKLDAGEDTLWFLDIEDQRVELTTRQLQNYREFQAVCMEQLTVFFMPMRAEVWASMIGEAMQNATIIEPAPEVTAEGHFGELLEEFVVNRHRGEQKADILLGKPWQDPESQNYYFRLQDLMRHLERAGFKSWGRNRVGRRIEQIGGGRDFFNISGKGTNVYYVQPNFWTADPTPLPESEDEPI